MRNKSNTVKRLTAGVLAIILLSICLCVTTFSLVMVTVTVENNIFRTGTVELNLNDGKPIIEEHEFLFEPGMTVEKEFFIESKSTWDVYYRVYFENVAGGLSDILEVSILDGERVLFSGKATELSRDSVAAADDTLAPGERRVLTARFHFPENAGNAAQDLRLSFDIRADAVQTKNNPDKLFD